jgi:putative transposase
MIELSTSSFYYKPKRSREEREREQVEIRALIEDVQKDFPRSGYRRVQRYLGRRGIRIGERRLRGVMEKYGLWAEIKRAWVKTTDSDHPFTAYPNLLPERRVDGVNQVWTADITYIRIENGFVCLTSIISTTSI